MATDGLPALMGMFADPVTVTAAGQPRSLNAIVLPQSRYIGDLMDVREDVWRLQCAKTDWPEPKRGDVVIHKGQNYRVERPDPEGSNAWISSAFLVAA